MCKFFVAVTMPDKEERYIFTPLQRVQFLFTDLVPCRPVAGQEYPERVW